MKFFSRKALVAGATAIAVSFAGVNVASAQSSNNAPAASSTTSSPAAPTTTTPEPGKGGSSDLRAKDIKEWIGIITAVVGALSAIYTFINKISK
ncbi:hypothetical protein [Corynebacterium flavescens]|uniref:Secreted protein n=1 Tax=Corynebacterium flavescens TaxID=28028 RepID=A0A1L7CM92_CORFL|nr:hypothetical protein [Corynebacterium flavescens]APT86954.1 hypothetical protein CFLV_06920 [Corynebacterium flavescens]KAA8722144.1 hypothetical protein F4V60_06765 [Corynebacterium flavescens]GEB96773.1 hypothetical protein CFL01nite_02680 [Corynebacterium flavescens]